MSSPIAKQRKSLFDKILIRAHQKLSHSNRVALLTDLILKEIISLNINKQTIRVLDVGCGDMSISNNLMLRDKALDCVGIDIYPNTRNWSNYKEFDGKKFPFEKKSFDITLFSDVLHHDYQNIFLLLNEAKRVSSFVIIKDHFEYGLLSRKVLQLADIIGNYGYGVSIPKRYLSDASFQDFTRDCGLHEIKRICPIHMYKHMPLINLVFQAKYQFLSVLECTLHSKDVLIT